MTAPTDSTMGEAMERPPWHCLDPGEAMRRLGSDPNTGLKGQVARRRLSLYGPNRLPEKPGPGMLKALLGQFGDFMILVLLAATALSYLLGEVVDAIAIALIVLLNALLGFVQEFRAERSLAALKQLVAPRARLLRDGRVQEAPAAEVVPGDVLILEAGDRVAADGLLFEAVAMAQDESALTGESMPVEKRVGALEGAGEAPAGAAGAAEAPAGAAADIPLGDRRNMVFQGTVVVRGRGRAVVVATGSATEMGGIAGLIQEAAEGPTPLQRRLDQLGRYLVLACLLISAVVAAGGLWRGEDPYKMLLTAVSLSVAAIPEGLPAVVTIVLALGTQRMLRRNAIIRRLQAVETLGCATVICSDKTGALVYRQ